MKQVNYDTIGENIFTEQLANGLNVILLPKREMAKTYAIFATNYGSIDSDFVPIHSNERITVPEGIAHFLEHKLFEKEDRDVFQDFGKQGASANAFTSFTTTAYLFSATDHILKNTETLIDFVQDPYFSEASVEKEKGIIGQEITMYDDQPEWRSFMGTIKGMFKNHPVNIDIAGTVDSIQHITKDDLYTCYHTFYHPGNMTLFVAGNFDENEMISMIRDNQANKNFESMEKIQRFYPEEPQAVQAKESKLQMPVSIPKCTIGIKELVTELDAHKLLKTDILLDMIMDYYYSKGGKYYQELYRESLIDGSFYYETNLEKNFGYSMIGSNTNDVEKFANKVKEQLLNTTRAVFTEEEFEKLKKKKIGQLLRGMNSLEYIANQYIHYHALGVDFFNILPEIEILSVDDVNDFLKNWITEDRLTVFQIVPEAKNA